MRHLSKFNLSLSQNLSSLNFLLLFGKKHADLQLFLRCVWTILLTHKLFYLSIEHLKNFIVIFTSLLIIKILKKIVVLTMTNFYTEILPRKVDFFHTSERSEKICKSTFFKVKFQCRTRTKRGCAKILPLFTNRRDFFSWNDYSCIKKSPGKKTREIK